MSKGYISHVPASKWQEGLLSGNGSIGALAWGFAKEEKVIFTHEWLYAPLYEKRTPPRTVDTLPQIRALLAERKYQEAADFVVEQGKREGFPREMDWTDPFVAACTLAVDLKTQGEPEQYEKAVDFENAVASVSFTINANAFKRELFVSRAHKIAVMRIMSEQPADWEIRLEELTETQTPDNWWDCDYTRHHLPPVISVKGDTITYEGSFKTVVRGYRCAVKVAKTDGTIEGTGKALCVKNAKETLLYFNVLPCDDLSLSEPDPRAAFEGLAPDYEELLSEHAAIHGGIYNRIKLDLDDPEGVKELAEDLWEQSRDESTPPPNAFFQQIFDAGRYEILCASGETPPNLQGIWTGTNHCPWSGDYTQNGNLQTAVLCNLPGNMFEMMDSFVNYEEYLIPDNRINAQTLYGARGMMLACRGNRHGLANHFGHNWCMTFWTAGAAWNSHFFYDYYLYSGDREFFIDHALPYMKECALFYEDFLIEDETGHWMFTPSYSPENNPSGQTAQACVNATMDVAVASELFHNLIEGCRTLGIEEENIPKWQEMLDKMPRYQINEDGALKEWMVPDLKDRYDHRHSSHLYMLYYGLPKQFKEDKSLYDAAEKAYEYRMKFKAGEKGQMAFGNVQMAFAAVHLKDSKTAWKILCEMAQNNYYKTFSSSHDMGPKVFNTDISGGVPALMLEMLIESHPVEDESGKIVSYEIELLPNLPTQWSKGKLSGVRARGGFTLDFSWENGKVVSCEVQNPCGNDYTLIGAGL